MKKFKLIIYCIIIVAIVSLLTYLNYDKILDYFTNREWEIADSIGKINFDSYLSIEGTSSNFVIIDSDSIIGYSEDVKKNFEMSADNKEIECYAAGDYTIIADIDTNLIKVISGNELVWSDTLNNANILGTYINKNGYSCVIYSQTGYKSLIRVYSNTGEELFTSYLPVNYAIDVAISNDNKTLAIGEIDTSGISVKSNIKLIDIKDTKQVNTYTLDDDELIVDLEYNEDNSVVVMTDKKAKVLKGNEFANIVDFNRDNVVFASIDNLKNIVTIQKIKNGLFDSDIFVNIYNYNTKNESKTYKLSDVPNNIYCYKNIIAVDMGNEIDFIKDNGNFMKKCEYKGQLKDLVIFNDGETAVLVFRDYAEFVKLGGI